MIWQIKILFVTSGLVGFTLMFTFMIKNFGMRPDTTMFLWLLGCVLGALFVIEPEARTQLVDPKLWVPLISILVLGMTVGTALNIGVGRIIPQAPNPAIPIAILNTAGVFVYLLAPMMAILLPRYFASADFSWRGLIGVCLAVIGTAMVATP